MYLSATRLAVGSPSGAAPTQLNFVMQSQLPTTSNWCWAVVTASIAAYYDPATTWTQCALASDAFPPANCCGSDQSGVCNQPWYLDTALTRTGHLASAFGGTVGFNVVQQQIAAQRPLAVRIAWFGGGAVGHFVVIDGYSTAGGQRVSVRDSIFGDSSWPFAAFQTSYKNRGSWSATYLTQ